MVLGEFPVPGRTTIWITVGQGPTALAVGAGGVFGHFYSHLSFLSSFSLSLGDGPIWTEILSQRAVKTQNNQPTNYLSDGQSQIEKVSFAFSCRLAQHHTKGRDT